MLVGKITNTRIADKRALNFLTSPFLSTRIALEISKDDVDHWKCLPDILNKRVLNKSSL